MPDRVDFKSPDELRSAAEDFLTRHHAAGTIPVPIEEIVEFDLGLEIRPFRGLKQRFDIDGALSQDLRTILVDEELMRWPNRYRTTLAHEVGHQVLHGDYMQSIAARDVGGWKVAVLGIDPQTYARMEAQAYMFAAYVLVPRMPLLESYREAARLALSHGIDLEVMGDAAMSYVVGYIAKEYQVSTEVLLKRLQQEGIG